LIDPECFLPRPRNEHVDDAVSLLGLDANVVDWSGVLSIQPTQQPLKMNLHLSGFAAIRSCEIDPPDLALIRCP